VPIKTVFERIKGPLNNGSTIKPSFAQVVNGGTRSISPNGNLIAENIPRTGNWVYRPKNNSKSILSGLLPFMKYKTFKAPDSLA
jgi:hypothetical protein